MVSRSVVCLVSWSVGQLPGCYIDQLVSRFDGCPVDQLVSRSVDHWSGGWPSVGRLVGRLVRWLVVGRVRSVGQLVSRSLGQLVSRSAGW